MTMPRLVLGGLGGIIGLLALLPLCVVGLPFLIVGFLTRRLAPMFDPSPVTWEKVIEFDEQLGWKAKPHLNLHCEAAPHAVFQVSTDAEGWRGKQNIRDCDIVVFGDSYAWGFGVHDHEFFADLDPQLKIKSIGVPGYSMVHELLLMKAYASDLQNKLVVWFVFSGNDLYDNIVPNYLHYRMPFVRNRSEDGEWEIVDDHVKKLSWPYNHDKTVRQRDKFLGTFGSNFLSERIYSACEFLIKEAHYVCEGAGAQLVVISIPLVSQLSEVLWKQQVKEVGLNGDLNRTLPDQKIEAICEKLGIPCVSLRSLLNVDDHIPEEGHWNSKGHQHINRILKQLFELYGNASVAIGESVGIRQHNL